MGVRSVLHREATGRLVYHQKYRLGMRLKRFQVDSTRSTACLSYGGQLFRRLKIFTRKTSFCKLLMAVWLPVRRKKLTAFLQNIFQSRNIFAKPFLQREASKSTASFHFVLEGLSPERRFTEGICRWPVRSPMDVRASNRTSSTHLAAQIVIRHGTRDAPHIVQLTISNLIRRS